jgi:uncharacterized iron-regulated membrane protein
MRKFVVQIHRYLGLAIGGLLLISGLTGSVIVFQQDIEGWLNPALVRVTPQAGRASLDDLMRNVRQAAPGKEAGMLFLPQAPDQALEIWFREDSLRAYANPYTGEILGIRKATDSLMGFLVDLHMHLLSGETGEQIMGWSGLGAIVLALLGLWLWWPKGARWKQAFSVKWQAAPIRVWLDMHKVAGALACAFLLLTAATGASLALYDIITEPALIALTGEGTKRPAPRSRTDTGNDAPLAPMVARAAAVFPQGQITRLNLPAQARSAVLVRMRLPGEAHQFGRTFLWFDRHDGSLLRVDNALEANLATRIQSWLYPLHTGFYGGLPTRGLQVLVGLALALLSMSGCWLWWKGYRARTVSKRRSHNKKRQQENCHG